VNENLFLVILIS